MQSTNSRSSLRAASRPAALGALALVFALLVLVGCAGYSPKGLQPGASEADVIKQMGTPTGRYKLPNGGTRLEYARGPQGRETFMIDFDRSGKMIEWEQVMSLRNLMAVTPGLSTEEVLVWIGHPGSTQAIKRQQLVLWNYRYPTNDCLWFQISIGDDGKVISGSQSIDPQCDAPSDSRGSGGGMGIGGR
jgi:hypothetical protein